ncbi:MAG: ABC transporter ATP-binding protein [Chloroflexi bacterium]|nr:ABC transporter ATP-binding protein [Chloroflexota bacterium]
MEPAIVLRNLTKRYGDLLAVDSINLDIYRGECFGFLGPNGAGKTSTMRMVSCVSPVTSGELLVDGMSVRREPRKVKAILGVVPQEDNLDPDLSVLENLTTYARYYDLAPNTALARAWESLFLFQLDEKAYQRIDTLSGGMKRRLLVARALLHQPSVLLLDEPTTGLDPQARHMVWNKLTALKEQGITMLLCTHYMDEAARLCDRLVIMDHGRILAQGSPDDLVREHVGRQVWEVLQVGERANSVKAAARQRGMDVEDHESTLYLFSPNGGVSPEDLGLEDRQVQVRTATLEDVFLRLAGRELREE